MLTDELLRVLIGNTDLDNGSAKDLANFSEIRFAVEHESNNVLQLIHRPFPSRTLMTAVVSN